MPNSSLVTRTASLCTSLSGSVSWCLLLFWSPDKDKSGLQIVAPYCTFLAVQLINRSIVSCRTTFQTTPVSSDWQAVTQGSNHSKQEVCSLAYCGVPCTSIITFKKYHLYLFLTTNAKSGKGLTRFLECMVNLTWHRQLCLFWRHFFCYNLKQNIGVSTKLSEWKFGVWLFHFEKVGSQPPNLRNYSSITSSGFHKLLNEMGL